MRKLIAIGATLALWLVLGAAQAAVFTVTSTVDTDGATCGNPCTLRQAINAANANVGADTINFNVSGSITLGSVLPVITDTLAIDGTGRSVSLNGGGIVQVLQLDGATSLALKSLTIANGRTTQNFSAGGVSVLAPSLGTPAGGATLSVVDCVFSANSANSGASAGAIMMFAALGGNTSLTVANSIFIGNSATTPGDPSVGAIYGYSGGAITISNSTFENNSGTVGAIYEPFGSLAVSGSTFVGNTAIYGGAIRVMNIFGTANTITNSTFYTNSSFFSGGAIYSAGGFDIPGRLTITNSTFSGNMSNSGNSVGQNGAIFASGPSHLALRNTVVERSTNGNCGALVIFDEGGNLSDDASCTFTDSTSLINTAAQLGPLQNNGGSTWTMAPKTGSPAIDQGTNQLAIDAGLTTDQRGTGFPRISPTGGRVDRGAFEVQVDNIPPTCAATARPNTLFDPNHKLVNITTTVTASDDNPGVTFTLRAVTSSEADSGLGRDDVPLDIQGWTVGSADLNGRLRNERFSRAGRIYTITYEAKDVAGNTTNCSATVTVPYKKR